MIRLRAWLLSLSLISVIQAVSYARPLLTEPVETVGRHSFETIFGISKRYDTFGNPEAEYDTVNFPIRAQFGVSNRFDIGIQMTYLNQRLQTEHAHFTGSQNGRLSPFVKYSPWEYLGFQFFLHGKKKEQGDQNLPVARGTDYEALALFKLPTAWPISFNVGYLFRNGYDSKLGVSNSPSFHVVPGDIFESKLALEVPLIFHFSLLGEAAYYKFERTSIDDREVDGSSGEAADALAGLTWAYGGWNLGFGAAFGLLEERSTSFDLDRGAGDVMYKASLSYKLTPRKPAP